jgi:ABC-type methionine transport system ATPase subunit
MEVARRLNCELGTTLVVVTHDPAVARRTDRIVELDSGCIAREHVVGDPFDEDWKDLRASALGQALLAASQPDLDIAGLPLYQDGQLTEAGRFLREMLVKTGAKPSTSRS